MKHSVYRRYRRSAARETGLVKKDNRQEQSFFGEATQENFFKPAVKPQVAGVLGKSAESDKEEKVQRTPEKKEEEKKLMKKKEKKEEEDKIQKKGVDSSVSTTTTASYINNLHGKGSSLPQSAQQFFGKRIGYDFSKVKIHNDQEAAESAKSVDAKAYAIGNHIVFYEGQYNPESTEGKKLMAHELVHVIQNQPRATNENIQRRTSTHVPDDAVINPRTHVATFSINSVNVVVEPDQTLRRGTSASFHGQRYSINRLGALTVSYLRPRLTPAYTGRGRNRRVTGLSLTFTLYIKTFFGTGAMASDPSAYGRGTTAADRTAGDTSLGFHESRHGQDYQDYIAQNPLPEITLDMPATIRQYNAAIRGFNREMRAYSAALGEYSHTNTDMVGTAGP